MTISYSYHVGETVTILPYSIFSSPTPTEWNEDPYGYGTTWRPGQTFIFTEPIEFFALYDPICINYYLTSIVDGQLLTELVSYVNRVGTRLEIAEFPWIENFKCWHDKDGNVVDSSSYVYLTATTDLFMSCNVEYTLDFNANGGNGSMDPIHATHSLYIDSSTKNAVLIPAIVVLPKSQFYASLLTCTAWQIDSLFHEFESRFTLTSNATAYAYWHDPTRYILDIGCGLVNEDYTFQYFMLKIDEFQDGNKIGRFSEILFTTSSGLLLEFNKSTTATSYNIESYLSTDPLDALDGSTSTNVVVQASSLPCGIAYDLQLRVLDLSKYNRMLIWTASNSTGARKYQCPKTFLLYVSNNKQNWYLADSYSGPVNMDPSSIMYESGTLFAESMETKIDFDTHGGDTPQLKDYIVKSCARGNGGCVDIGYVPTENTKIAFLFRTFGQYSGHVYVGNIDGSNDNTDFRFFATSANDVYWDMSGYRWHWNTGTTSRLDASRWYTVECSKNGLVVDSVSRGTRSGSYGSLLTKSICLFGTIGKEVDIGLKYFKIYESGTLKIDLAPAIDRDNRSCLVDLLTDLLYYSQNGVDIYCYDNSATSMTRAKYVGDSNWTEFEINGLLSLSSIPNRQNLAAIEIGDGVTSIGEIVFLNCTSLESIVLPKTISSIAAGAFYNCAMLTAVSIPDSVESIGNSAFSKCTSIESIAIPSGVLSIGNGAFENCSSLKSAVIYGLSTTLGQEVFRGCTSLEDVTLPSGITEIRQAMFWQCRSLTSITIPADVLYVRGYAFYGCESLKSVQFKGNAPHVDLSAFSGVAPRCIALVYPSTEGWPLDGDTWNGLVVEYSYLPYEDWTNRTASTNIEITRIVTSSDSHSPSYGSFYGYKK